MRVIRQRYPAWSLPLLLSLPLGLLAALLEWCALRLPPAYAAFLKQQGPTFQTVFLLEGIRGFVLTLTVLCAVGTAVCFAGFVIGLRRRPWALTVLRGCYWAAYGGGLIYTYAVLRVTDLIVLNDLKVNGATADAVTIFFWRYDWLWPAALLLLGLGSLHVLTWRRRTLDLYTGYREALPAAGDRLVENIRIHGREPRWRKSVYGSLWLHFMVIILIPFLARFGGCVEDYRVPEGSGSPVVSIVKIVKPKKQPKKRYILNPKSAISFHIPDLDDSKLTEEVEEATQLTYEADAASAHQVSRLGAGKGTKGGWPDGMKNAVVRFIRLEYNGEDWNDGMDTVSRADINFLEEFHKVTGFKVATHGESHPIHLLDDYTKGFAPPFIYMTGSGAIHISPREIEILRKYLVDGGMLFADCGSPQWDRSFRNLMQALFPGEPLFVVADDDPIYQMPYVFPNGAPPLWHHGGSRALGLKRGRRWTVYYFPGDLNDAWKTGHSGMNPYLARRSYQLGINVVYHAFTHYLEATRKYRK